MEFKTHYGNTPTLGEINLQPSQTIPEQSYSVKEIMTRFAQGLGWTGPKVPVYDNGEDPLEGINLDNLDLSERQEMLQQVTERISVLRQEMAERQKPKKLKAPQADLSRDDSEKVQFTPVDNNEQDELK